MTKPKGIFKKRKNKGNQHYRTNIVLQNEVSLNSENIVVNTESVTTPPSASKKKTTENRRQIL